MCLCCIYACDSFDTQIFSLTAQEERMGHWSLLGSDLKLFGCLQFGICTDISTLEIRSLQEAPGRSHRFSSLRAERAQDRSLLCLGVLLGVASLEQTAEYCPFKVFKTSGESARWAALSCRVEQTAGLCWAGGYHQMLPGSGTQLPLSSSCS